MSPRSIALLLLAPALAGAAGATSAEPGTRGGDGLALRCAKVLVCSDERDVVDRALVLVEDGRIVDVGRESELEVPDGYEVLDLGESWIIPGLVDLHSHVGGSFDINGAVYQANPGLRVQASVVPDNEWLRRGVAGGVTSILYIPGSATTIGGQGILLKTTPERFEEMRIRDPGSLKLAQADNPKRWGYGMGRLMLNWQIRETLRRGLAYARRWLAHERGEGEAPAVDPQWEVFRDLLAGRTQISAHTQVYQVVYSTIRIVRMELGLDVYIDHGSFDGFLAAELAQEQGVAAICGPRSVSSRNWGRGLDHDGKIVGFAGEYQRRGHTAVGFNTDAYQLFIVPQEELALQAAMGVRYGFDDSDMDDVRGLTIVPARTAGIDDRVGSIEAGKDADIVVVSGHPADPRNSVELVFVEGKRVYDADVERRF